MTKSQKIWLGVFLAMFIVPEVIFSFLISSLASLFSFGFSPLYKAFINPQFFIDHPGYLYIFLLIEWFGVLGLLILNAKHNFGKYRTLGTVALSILLVLLIIIFYIGYAISNINFL